MAEAQALDDVATAFDMIKVFDNDGEMKTPMSEIDGEIGKRAADLLNDGYIIMKAPTLKGFCVWW